MPAKGDCLQRLVDDDGDVVAGERFGNEIDGAELHGLDGEFDRTECRQHHDRRHQSPASVWGRMFPNRIMDLLKDLKARKDRKLNVQEHKVGLFVE